MKSILIIVPYDNIFPPMNGGMQRCFHIMHQLSKHFNLTAIIHQDKASFLKSIEDFPSLANAVIYSTRDVETKDIFSLLPQKIEIALRSRWYEKEWNKAADSSLVKYYPLLISLLAKQKFDVIILENLATLNAIRIIRRYDKNVKIVYNAHNVDSTLVRAAYNRKEVSASILKSYEETESNFYKQLDAVIICSKDDKKVLGEMNGGKLLIEVVPNGVVIPTKVNNKEVSDDHPNFILFCGSLGSIANAEGLQWFCKLIWPLVHYEFSDLQLLVVGVGVLPAMYEDIKSTQNIIFTGGVDDVKPYYEKSSIAIVPLITGSGTRLKVLEAMGLGVSVVSTSIGAEGIDYTDGVNILIGNGEIDFAKKIVELLKDKNKRMQLQVHARQLAIDMYDWDIIGESMAAFIKNINDGMPVYEGIL